MDANRDKRDVRPRGSDRQGLADQSAIADQFARLVSSAHLIHATRQSMPARYHRAVRALTAFVHLPGPALYLRRIGVTLLVFGGIASVPWFARSDVYSTRSANRERGVEQERLAK